MFVCKPLYYVTLFDEHERVCLLTLCNFKRLVVLSSHWHHNISYILEFMNHNRTVQENRQYCPLLCCLQQNSFRFSFSFISVIATQTGS